MTKRAAVKSPILKAVHETASDLHRLGHISQRKMSQYDALCLEPVKHDHKAFLERASKKRGFREAYDALRPNLKAVPTK